LYEVTDLMDRAPTWMAVQAKATILYEKAFWRERGLSGRVVSHIGPMFEVHDHCDAQSGQAALFGFIAWPPEQRAQRPDELRREIKQQLIRCFGEGGGAFSKLIVQDWAQEKFICSDRDLRTQPSHPDILPAALREPQLNGRIHFAVSETADISPGLIEGAIQSGKRAAASILK